MLNQDGDSVRWHWPGNSSPDRQPPSRPSRASFLRHCAAMVGSIPVPFVCCPERSAAAMVSSVFPGAAHTIHLRRPSHSPVPVMLAGCVLIAGCALSGATSTPAAHRNQPDLQLSGPSPQARAPTGSLMARGRYAGGWAQVRPSHATGDQFRFRRPSMRASACLRHVLLRTGYRSATRRRPHRCSRCRCRPRHLRLRPAVSCAMPLLTLAGPGLELSVDDAARASASRA